MTKRNVTMAATVPRVTATPTSQDITRLREPSRKQDMITQTCRHDRFLDRAFFNSLGDVTPEVAVCGR